MSVINKMLNDLDNRQEEQADNEADVAFLQQPDKPKTKKWLLVLTAVLLVVGLAAAAGYWFLLKPNSGGAVIQKPQPIAPTQKTAQQNEQQNDPKGASTVAAKPKSATSDSSENLAVIIKPKAIGEPESISPTLSVQTGKQPSRQTNNNEKDYDDNVSAEGNGNVTNKLPEEAEQAVIAAKKAPAKMQVKSSRVTPKQRGEKIYKQAQKLSRQGMITQAIEKFHNALKLDPLHSKARSGLAALYFGREKSGSALSVLNEGLLIEGDNIDWSILAAKIYYKQQHYAGALKYLQLPVNAAEQVEYVALKAASLQQLKRFSQASIEFQRLTEVNPGNGRWWLGLGTIYEAQGDTAPAISAYRKALALSNISQNSRQFVQSRLRVLEQ
ncbi:MAG: MSHA biogenesis protein MshN [Phenylobacterium sp.]